MPRATASIAYATFILVILGGIVFTTFVTVPAVGTFNSLREEREERRVELGNQQQLREELTKRERDLQTYSQQRGDLDIMIPNEFNQANFLAAIEHAAQEARIRIQTIGNPAQPSSRRGEELGLPNNIAAIDVPVSVVGTYASFREFVDRIEQMPVLSHVHSVDISLGAGLEIDLTIRTYTQSISNNM